MQYDYIVHGPDFMLNGREYVRGDRVTGADAVTVESEVNLRKRCVRVLPEAPAPAVSAATPAPAPAPPPEKPAAPAS